MDEKILSKCFTLLSVMNCGREQPWDEAHKDLYELLFERIGSDEEALSAVQWAALHEEWRPSPARLLAIASEQASPIPDAEQCYAEIIIQAQNVGIYGKPDPNNPNIRLAGPPPFSHPVVGQIAAYCGGWEFICSGEANMQEGLRKQVRGAHESVGRQWFEEVGRQLLLAPAARNRRYFPQRKMFAIPPDWTGSEGGLPMLLPPKEEREEHPVMPSKLRELIAGIKALPAPEPKKRFAGCLTAEQRKAAELELRS